MPSPVAACDACGSLSSDHYLCSRCKSADYCSPRCQKKAWKGKAPALAANGGGPPPHREWCVAPSEVDKKARHLSELIKRCALAIETEGSSTESLDQCMTDLMNEALVRSPPVWDGAVEKYGLHECILRGFFAETRNTLAGETEVGMYSLAHILFNYALSGIRINGCFLRQGNSCSDEERVLKFLREDVDVAWPAWMAIVEAHYIAHFASGPVIAQPTPPGEVPTSIQLPRDLLVATIYALSLNSVSDLVLTHHASTTWEGLGKMIKTAAKRGNPANDPNKSLEGYAITAAALLRKQALDIKGPVWMARELRLRAAGLDRRRNPLQYGRYDPMGRASALAFVEKGGNISSDDLNGGLRALRSHDSF